MTKETPKEQADRIIKRNEALKTKRTAWMSFWRDCADYVSPRKSVFFTGSDNPDNSASVELFDNTAIRANMTLASGQMSFTTPAGSRWFVFEPPARLRGNDKAERWYSLCTEIVQKLVSQSNFYNQIMELYLDRGGFGTSVILIDKGKNSPLRFQTFSIGSYCLAEDDEGLVDTIYREFRLTAGQARKKFGEDALSPKMRKLLEDRKHADHEKEFLFIHAIEPREDEQRDGGKIDAENMPLASVYVDVENKHVCENGGYPELPACASRFLKWGEAVYGWSPTWMALPESKQKNFLEQNLDALAEVKAWPRLLIPTTQAGRIDLAAGGQTFFDPTVENAKPEAWADGGDYTVAVDRADRKQKAIEQCYHVDMFQMFANLDKANVTATEIAARESEKLVQFSPFFSLMVTELFNPMMLRVFRVIARQGILPPPPPEVFVMTPTGPTVPEPEVTYSSKIAMAISALENGGLVRTLANWMPLLEVRADILDNADLDVAFRDSAKNDGWPERWILPVEQRDAIRKARAEQQAMMQKAQESMMAAEVAGKVGGIKKDSLAGELIKDAA